LTDTSGTFGGAWDRITYIVAEAQLLVAGTLITIGLILLWTRPEIPGIPPWVGGVFAALLVFGPPLFGFFVWLIRKFRRRNMVPVHHINAVTDTAEKRMVAPEIWKSKNVNGPNPYPVNGGSAWAVREFEYHEEIESLTVRGVWLSEAEDVKLMTSKGHMQSIYEKLSQSHMALKYYRDSVTEFSAEVQGRLINRMAEARERGTMMDKTAVKDVMNEFEDRIDSLGADDLPQVEDADLPGDVDDLADHAVEEMDAETSMADDGGAADD